MFNPAVAGNPNSTSQFSKDKIGNFHIRVF